MGFKRHGNVRDALKIGLYYSPWHKEKVQKLPNGYYIGIHHTKMNCIFLKRNWDSYSMQTLWAKAKCARIRYIEDSFVEGNKILSNLNYGNWFKRLEMDRLIYIGNTRTIVSHKSWNELIDGYS